MSNNHFLGGLWPVVQRELREGARRPVNHRLRFLSALVGTLLLWKLIASSSLQPNQLGGYLLSGLHALLLGLIFAIVPGLTADCIAREKREGTLGLLFLTPLSAGGIVAGKSLVQALRAFTLWLAVLPILIIPFTTGGVTWFDALTALSLEFCAMALCLGAGLLASSLAKERNTVFILAYVFGAGFLFLLTQFLLASFGVALRTFAKSGLEHWWGASLQFIQIYLGMLHGRGGFTWWSLFLTNPAFARIWESFCLCAPLVTLLFFYLIARFAARRISRSWQDKLPSARHESLLKRYCTPLFQRRYRRKMQRTLDWNPIAWLQQYSWKSRLTKWGLCLAFVLVECVTGGSFNFDNNPSVHCAELLTLAAIYTFAGVSGFLEEKRNGALELLLVTPLPVNKLIFGRVWGLWKQFLPAALVLAVSYAGWLWNNPGDWEFNTAIPGPIILACVFLTLPVFATYFALRVKNLFVAAVLTWVALYLPLAFVIAAFGVNQSNIILMLPAFPITYAAFALLACFLLRHSLSRRIYSF